MKLACNVKSSAPGSKFGVLLTAIILTSALIGGYWPVIEKIVRQWESGDNSYCYLIVPLFAYLCWEKKEVFRFGDFTWSIMGPVLALLAAGLIYMGESGSVETMLYVGLWASGVSVLVFLYGRRTWHLVFPVLILLFIVPLPPFINRMLTFEMKLIASQLSTMLFRLIDIPVHLEGNIIDLGVGKLEVANACSGLRYLASMVLMAILVGYYFTRGWWRRGVILALVPPLLITFNAFRIFLTGLLIINGYKSLAAGGYHDAVGLFLFLLAGIIFTITAKILARVGSSDDIKLPVNDCGVRTIYRPAAIAMILLMTLIFTGGGTALRSISGSTSGPARKDFKSFPMEINGWQGEWHYLSDKILASLWADDYVNATFTRPDSRSYIYLLIPFYNYQATRHTAHAPQSCLLGGGYSLGKSGDRAVITGSGARIMVREMVLHKGEQKMLASYFFLQRGRVITNPWLNKMYLMWDSIVKRRTDGALVRVEITVPPEMSVEQARKDLDSFIAALWDLLPQYVPQ